jgi:hypothetical protein
MYFIKNWPEKGAHFNKLLVSEEFIIRSNRSTVSGHKTPFIRTVNLQVTGLHTARSQGLTGM